MDPVEKLFRDLPSPDADQAALEKNGVWDQDRFMQVVTSYVPSKSKDKDRQFVAEWAKSFAANPKPEALRSELGRFALEKPKIPSDGSSKTQQLKYHAWISQGRKDEDYPFKAKESSDEKRVDHAKCSHTFLPAELTDTKICADCGKPDAQAACGGCLVKLDSHVVMKTAYCNATCQARHWSNHKSKCLGRKKISLAVDIIYNIFVTFQKTAWIEKQIACIAEQKGITNITHRDDPNIWALQGKPFVRNFPSDITPSEEHALAVLFDSECQQLMSTCHDVVRLLLMPLCKQLQEVFVMPRNAHRPTCDIRSGRAFNTMYSRHTVLCATLKSGEQFAIDVTGAQFGWRETVAPWGVWVSHRVAGKPCFEPFGSSQQTMQMIYPYRASQHLNYSESQLSTLVKDMQVAIQNKMDEHNAPSAIELYKLHETAFDLCKNAMLSVAEESLTKGLDLMHAAGVGRCYIDASGQWQATTTPKQADALKQIWITDKDMKNAKGRDEKLYSMYLMRCKCHSKKILFRDAGLNMPDMAGRLNPRAR
ncbi:hypothetical protein F4808DRAFT_472679 [Astrocystis sublimbata]|nr:hypothetical protein F4808DRAFT_472679 [Astrocystis sublimbata]